MSAEQSLTLDTLATETIEIGIARRDERAYEMVHVVREGLEAGNLHEINEINPDRVLDALAKVAVIPDDNSTTAAARGFFAGFMQGDFPEGLEKYRDQVENYACVVALNMLEGSDDEYGNMHKTQWLLMTMGSFDKGLFRNEEDVVALIASVARQALVISGSGFTLAARNSILFLSEGRTGKFLKEVSPGTRKEILDLVLGTCITWIRRDRGRVRDSFVDAVLRGIQNGVFDEDQRKRLTRFYRVVDGSRKIAVNTGRN
ncbi:hypothetical protein JW710_01735 [Candidatus Dojkabacteria bacterium]|nr:hypothetical protein [Candidatus Dojkabacteria bacterium]